MNINVSNKTTQAIIFPNADGSFIFDNGYKRIYCQNADVVGAYTEELLWPLLADMGLKEGKKIIITIENGTD